MQRQRPVTVWLNEAEYQHLAAACEAAGIGVSTGVRMCVRYCLSEVLDGGLIGMLVRYTLREQLRLARETQKEGGEK